jgi:signal transduction histidine kinase
MSLRLRLFLLVAGLAVLLVAGEALLVRSLASRLDSDLQVVATRVGEQILSGFAFEAEEPPSAGTRKIVFVTSEAAPGAPASGSAAAGGDAPAKAPGEGDAPRWVVRHEWKTTGPEPGEVANHVDVRVFAGHPPAAAGAEARVRPFVLEPRADSDVLLLRGPDAGREIRIPHRPVAATLGRFRSQLALGSLGILALGLVAAALLAHRVTRPLARLERAAVRVGAGELGVEVPVERDDEVGSAVGAFNAMSVRLAELDRENRRLAENERLSELGEVARGIAHTLRNPLNALGLSIEELAGGPDAGRAAALAETSRRQIRRLDGALRSFLALASADAAEAESVDLVAVAREVALEALQDAGGRLRIEVAADSPVIVEAVAAEIKAMIQALVVNACEASPAGARVVVRVAEAGGGGARVEVEDEGPGVAPEVLARLGSPHLTTKAHGSGMGLFLAQRLASGRYGGAVELARREGAGTRATVLLGARRTPATNGAPA